jgi:hypothetical protein
MKHAAFYNQPVAKFIFYDFQYGFYLLVIPFDVLALFPCLYWL